MALLQARALPPLLAAVNTGGIKLTMLMDARGALLGCAGDTIVDTDGNEVAREAIAAIVSNIWSDFDAARNENGNSNTISRTASSNLECMELDLQCGRVAVSKVCSDFLVCCIAETSAQPGLVKMKLQKAGAALASELAKLDL